MVKAMSLINCPECGKRISDKSQACIHCGYPLLQNITIGTNHPLYCPICKSQEWENDSNKNAFICKKCRFEYGYSQKQSSNISVQQNIPKCPMCGSTNISKISTISRATSIIGFGILSNKIGKQWQCNNPKCKHMW